MEAGGEVAAHRAVRAVTACSLGRGARRHASSLWHVLLMTYYGTCYL